MKEFYSQDENEINIDFEKMQQLLVKQFEKVAYHPALISLIEGMISLDPIKRPNY